MNDSPDLSGASCQCRRFVERRLDNSLHLVHREWPHQGGCRVRTEDKSPLGRLDDRDDGLGPLVEADGV